MRPVTAYRRAALAAMAAGSLALAACSGSASPSSPSPVRAVAGADELFSYHEIEPPLPPDLMAGAPGAPCGLQYTPSDVDPVLSWRAPMECDPAAAGDPPTSYIVEVGNVPGETLHVVDTGSAATTYQGGNEGPIDGRGYARVRARNAYGVSLPSEEIRYDNHGQ